MIKFLEEKDIPDIIAQCQQANNDIIIEATCTEGENVIMTSFPVETDKTYIAEIKLLGKSTNNHHFAEVKQWEIEVQSSGVPGASMLSASETYRQPMFDQYSTTIICSPNEIKISIYTKTGVASGPEQINFKAKVSLFSL